MPMLHQKISHSSSWERQYSAEATNVLGTVAGRGDATATKTGETDQAQQKRSYSAASLAEKTTEKADDYAG